MAASIIGRWIKIQYKPLYNWKKKCREFGFWRIWENIQVRCVRSEGCFPYFCLFFNQLERICDLTALKLNTFFSTDIKSPLSCNSTETRRRRLRNTWKSCMKRNIMRNPCKLYFCFLFFFFTLARSKCYRTIIIHRLEVIMGVHSLVGCVWETICDLE